MTKKLYKIKVWDDNGFPVLQAKAEDLPALQRRMDRAMKKYS